MQMTKAANALWQEKLAALDAKYNLQEFIFTAMDLPQDHANFAVVSRILDILDVLRNQEFDFNSSGPAQTGRSGDYSNASSPTLLKRNPIQEAFLIKIEQYKQRMNSPTVGSSMRQAFRAKIEAELKKMQAKNEEEMPYLKPDQRQRMKLAF